jgi:hypothetical protein
MSDKPDGLVVRLLRWIDSGISRLIERTGRTEQQAWATQLSVNQIVATLARIEARLDQIEQRLPPRSPGS